jgi:hypothetical protein
VSDRRFNTQMARATQRHEVERVVGHVLEKEVPAPLDVVNVKGSAFAQSTAEAADFIAVQNRQPNALPMRSEFECAATAPIGMRRANNRSLRAFMRTESPSSLFLARKCSELFAAMLACQFLSGYEPFTTAFEGAMPHCRLSFAVEDCSANSAWDRRKSILAAKLGLARWVAELKNGFLFHNVARTLKLLIAIGAREHWPIDHRSRMTRFSAEDRLGKVGLKIVPALGACLDH